MLHYYNCYISNSFHTLKIECYGFPAILCFYMMKRPSAFFCYAFFVFLSRYYPSIRHQRWQSELLIRLVHTGPA